jgi:hypothetical protein
MQLLKKLTAAQAQAVFVRHISRVHQLWCVREDVLRSDPGHSNLSIEFWQSQFESLRNEIDSLEQSFDILPKDDQPSIADAFKPAVAHSRKHLDAATESLINPNKSPTDRLHNALGELRHCRLALMVLMRQICKQSYLLNSISKPLMRVSGLPQCSTLHFDLDEIATAANAFTQSFNQNDIQKATLGLQQFYLSFFRALTFDEAVGQRFFASILDGHEKLVSILPPGVTRDNVYHRMAMLLRLSPDRFQTASHRALIAVGNPPHPSR